MQALSSVIGDAPSTLVVGVFIIAALGCAALSAEKMIFGGWRHGGTIFLVTTAVMAAWCFLYAAAGGFIDGFTHPGGNPAPVATLPSEMFAPAALSAPSPDVHVSAFATQNWMLGACFIATAAGVGLAAIGMRGRAQSPVTFLLGTCVVVASILVFFFILIPNTA